MEGRIRKKFIGLFIMLVLIISVIIAVNWSDSTSKYEKTIPPLPTIFIFTYNSHNLSYYKLTVGDITSLASIEHWTNIDDITYLITNLTNINPGVTGVREPALSILTDPGNVSNLVSGKVKEIENNTGGYVTFNDLDDNDLISIDDEFIIHADIIPINSLGGIDFYLIYEKEHSGKMMFKVMERHNLGRYAEHIQLSLEKENEHYNITIENIDETFFQNKTISDFSIRFYNIDARSTLLWQNIIELYDNSSVITFYNYANNSNLSISNYFIIRDEITDKFIFEIYLESNGLKIGFISNF